MLRSDSISSLEAFFHFSNAIVFSSSSQSDLRLFSLENKQKSYKSEVRRVSEPKLGDYAKMWGKNFQLNRNFWDIVFYESSKGLWGLRGGLSSKILCALLLLSFKIKTSNLYLILEFIGPYDAMMFHNLQ